MRRRSSEDTFFFFFCVDGWLGCVQCSSGVFWDEGVFVLNFHGYGHMGGNQIPLSGVCLEEEHKVQPEADLGVLEAPVKGNTVCSSFLKKF